MYGIFSTLEGVCVWESGSRMRGKVGDCASDDRSKRLLPALYFLSFWGLDPPLSYLTPPQSDFFFYLCSASAHYVLSQDRHAQREHGASLQRLRLL